MLHKLVVHYFRHNSPDYGVLYKILTDGFLVAGVRFLYVDALVVMINRTFSARSAFAAHHSLALAAEQMRRQKIEIARFMNGRRVSIYFYALLHFIE